MIHSWWLLSAVVLLAASGARKVERAAGDRYPLAVSAATAASMPSMPSAPGSGTGVTVSVKESNVNAPPPVTVAGVVCSLKPRDDAPSPNCVL